MCMVKCNCLRLKYLVLYYKTVIALMLGNIVPSKLVQYNILLEIIFLNVSAITL